MNATHNLQEQLNAAVLSNNLEEITQLIDMGVDGINASYAMNIAIINDIEALFHPLIELGADHYTAAYTALSFDKKDLFYSLFKTNIINPNLALCIAIENNKTLFFSPPPYIGGTSLFDNGAEVDEGLYFAASINATMRTLKTLVELGAHPGRALDIAIDNNADLSVIERLISCSFATATTALEIAVEKGRIDLFKPFIEIGGDIDMTFYTAVSENPSMLIPLSELGGNIIFPILYALDKSNIAALDILIAAKKTDAYAIMILATTRDNDVVFDHAMKIMREQTHNNEDADVAAQEISAHGYSANIYQECLV